MKKITLSAIVLCSLLTSCKKDENPVKPCELNTASVIGSYKIEAIGYKEDANTPEIDLLATLDACAKDDIIIFEANNKMTVSDAGQVCVPSAGFTTTWSLAGDKMTIDTLVYTVSGFDCKKIKGSAPLDEPGEYRTITLVKQ